MTKSLVKFFIYRRYVRQFIYSFIFLFVGFAFTSQVAAETWYVKKSKTKLQASKKNQGSIFSSTHPTSSKRFNLLQKSASRYKKASLYPTLGNRYKLAIKRQN
jgi:hypothetical protein